MIIAKTKIAIAGEDWDVIDLIESLSDFEIAGLFAPAVVHVGDIDYLGSDADWKSDSDLKIALAVDLPHVRAKLFEHYGSAVISLVSPHAYISLRAQMAHGCIIQRGVTIMPHAKLGDACKVNVNATIHHDAKIGNFCTIAPGALILGNVVIEDGVYVGAGAIIKQRCRVGRGAVIGAGAVVVRDVPPNQTVVGVPAKAKNG